MPSHVLFLGAKIALGLEAIALRLEAIAVRFSPVWVFCFGLTPDPRSCGSATDTASAPTVVKAMAPRADARKPRLTGRRGGVKESQMLGILGQPLISWCERMCQPG